MPKPSITLYVDIVSPFVWIAFHVLENSPVFKQCEIKYVPIFLGGLMHACGNTAPVHIKNKDKWINTERTRWATYFNVPISQSAPPNFPVNTLQIQRVLTALSQSHPGRLVPALELFWRNFWVRWNEPATPEKMLAIVRTVVGGDEEEARGVLEAAKGEAVKKRLVENTEEAFKEGAFGLPWFVATNANGVTEGFWGVDHMGQMVDHLGLDQPEGKAWKALL